LTDLGFDNARATAINDRGQVVVRNIVAPWHTVVWDNGVSTDLGALGDFVASASNAKGQILGQTETASGKIRAALWDNGVLRDLGSLDGGESYPRALNDRGQVIGRSSFAISSTDFQLRGFLWESGVMRNLGTLGDADSTPSAVNDLGHVVGASGGNAFVWKNGHMGVLPTLPGCRVTGAVDLNDHDQIIGVCYTSTGPTQALMWRPRHSP
jgi:probable HAF family extracellular repeat protein